MVLKNYSQGSNGETDIEDRFMNMGRGDKRVRYMKSVTCGSLLYGSGNSTGALYQPRGVGWGQRWEGGSKREGIYVYLWLIHTEV